MKTIQLSFYLILILTFSLLVLSNCAKEPVKELEQAETIFMKANEANAQELATVEYEKALNKLNYGKKLINSKRYNDAKSILLEACDLADSAYKIAVKANELSEKNRIKEAKIKQEQILKMEKERAELASKKAIAEKIALEKKMIEEKKKQKPSQYIVVKNDCLWNIAKKVYNNPIMWKMIYDANKHQIENPDLIFPKQVLVIPIIDEQAQPKIATKEARTTDNIAQEKAEEKTSLKENNVTQQVVSKYVVVKGDCLWNIAKSIYNEPLKWKQIHQANIEIISNPDLIFPNQVLIIPS